MNTLKNTIFICTWLLNIVLIDFSYPQYDYVKGEVLVGLKEDLFQFPSEYCGIFISFNNTSGEIKIDSVIHLNYKQGSRQIENEDTISYDYLQIQNRADNIIINFPESLIGHLNNFNAYYIGRVLKYFSPQDTIPHYVQTRLGKKLIKSHNHNKHLIIKFKSDFDANEIAQKIKEVDCIEYAHVNEIVREF